MSEAIAFGETVLLTAAVGMAALLSNRVTERIRVPAPLLVLVAAAVAVKVFPNLHAPSERTVERLVTVALVCILFDGGLHIGRNRLRAAAAPVALVGVLGTFLTVAGAGVFIHLAFGISWYLALVVATAVAPTDPAVVFSVLGKREVSGRSGTILEGESGANDPVGIALMISLLAAGELSGSALGDVAGQFLLQMGVGGAVGLLGGRALQWFVAAVPLPSEALYPLRTTAGAFIIFGVATVAHGSGFLAVFVAGILLGDARAPYKAETKRFQAALASLGEILAFVVLGLTVDLGELTHLDVWLPGVLTGLVVAAVVRPIAVGLCLVPSRLQSNERNFVLFAGLKGAVPILLGNLILAAHVAHAERLYGIVVVVVVVSVAIQGTLVPAVAHRLRLPMRTVEPEPWALGVRLREEPEGVHRFTVAAGSPADGTRIGDLTELPEDAWISLAVRDNRLMPISGTTELRHGDELTILADRDLHDRVATLFAEPTA
ncbi:MAG: cation:proton antiporter [Actinomycetota bacterium]|nr:cation:proton antiporter [Actinomycetota bacterium]